MNTRKDISVNTGVIDPAAVNTNTVDKSPRLAPIESRKVMPRRASAVVDTLTVGRNLRLYIVLIGAAKRTGFFGPN